MQMYILVYKCVTLLCVVVFGVPVVPWPTGGSSPEPVTERGRNLCFALGIFHCFMMRSWSHVAVGICHVFNWAS